MINKMTRDLTNWYNEVKGGELMNLVDYIEKNECAISIKNRRFLLMRRLAACGAWKIKPHCGDELFELDGVVMFKISNNFTNTTLEKEECEEEWNKSDASLKFTVYIERIYEKEDLFNVCIF